MIRFLAKKVLPEEQRTSAVESLIIMVLAIVVVFLLVTQITSWQARHRDAERRQDMATLQEAITSYYALQGQYPASLSQISNLSATACQAPKGHGSCAQPDYSYTAFSPNTEPSVNTPTNCDNKKVACAGYILYTTAMEKAANPYILRSY